MKKEQLTYQEEYVRKWKGIVENEDGTLNKDQVMRELADYQFIMDQLIDVYEEVTVGRISKLMTYGSEVVRIHDEHFINRSFAIDDISEMAEDGFVELQSVIEYLKH
ncbi:hypothetical protein [Psychrobacillus phage Perkons]|nr:hypothetical protein [Psychrobacillus phage Perkons]